MDEFDLEELVRLWNHQMCDVSLADIQKTVDEIGDVFEIGIKLLELRHGLHK